MFLLLLFVTSVAANFDANLRISLTNDHVTGYMMMSLLLGKKHSQILTDVRNGMADKAFPENRLRDILGEAYSFGVLPQEGGSKLTWREERFKVAKDLLVRYNNDKTMFDRVVAIDELTVLYGRLEMIAACSKSELILIDFVRDGKAKNKDIVNFLAKLADELKVSDPLILWDNINVHTKNKDVSMFLIDKEWEALPHPVASSDMHPLDYHDFKLLKKEWSVKPDMTIEQAEAAVRTAVSKINSRRGFQGISKLPEIWSAVVRTEGLMTA